MKRERLKSPEDKQDDRFYEESRDTLERLKKELKIDKHDLDTELIHQPQIFYQVAEQYALAISLRDQAHSNLREVEARLSREIREEAQQNDEKLTADQLKAAVREEPVISRLVALEISWGALAGMWEALKESFKQRAWALKDLVGLHLSAYYVDNSGGYDRRQASERQHDKNRQVMKDERKKHKRRGD